MKRFLIMALTLPHLLILARPGTVEKPVIDAVRTVSPIIVDGKLDEPVWKGSPYTLLVQRDPVEGADPTEKTEVYVAYTDKGLYVAGRCFQAGTDSIAGGVGRRDEELESDWFWFWIDADEDRQSGFGFAVNPDGSIMDKRLYQDIYSEDDWDGIWESAAYRNGTHWSFEMYIPFSQLRFNKKKEYAWGVNFMRYILAKAERDYFSMVPKEENGFVSQFGILRGLTGIEPPARLFISPYVMGKYNAFPVLDGSAFETSKRYGQNAGLNIKYGLTGNLTLDLAVNPDFGQAEVDPAVINLTAFETYYSERREFFIEGADIFQFGTNPAGGTWGCYWNDPDIFYSRRIGRRPAGRPSHEGESDIPEQTTILGAAKVSGKIGKWSVGAVNAVTQREFARVDSAGVRFEDAIEPLTYYGVYRGVREFEDGDHGLGFIATSTLRNDNEDAMGLINNDQALVGGIDGWTFFGNNRDWALMGKMAYSAVKGSTARIARLQQSSNHYFQRQDFESASLDTGRTSLSGWMGRFGLKKMRGRFTAQAALGIISPGFNVNDLGYSSRTNVINWHVVAGYRWLKPKKWYRQIQLFGMTSQNSDFDGNVLFRQVYGTAAVLFPNYYEWSFSLQRTPDGLDPFLTRGGPLMAYPGYLNFGTSLNTDQRKQIWAGLSFTGRFKDDGGYNSSISAGISFRPGPSVRLNFSVNRTRALDHHQWVANVDDPAVNLGGHYIFADIKQEQLSGTFRVDWGITPTLSLQGYFQPFIAVGSYSGYKELAQARTNYYNPYEFNSANPDFNFKSFRGNVVLRWEYLPGSLLYLVWTQDRANYDNPGRYRPGRDFEALFREPSNNVFFVKLSYMFQL